MTSKFDLGPTLLGAGLAVSLIAIIAGFIAVGGPGNARNERLDNAQLNILNYIGEMAVCNFETSGRIPESIEQLQKAHSNTPVDDRSKECKMEHWSNDEMAATLANQSTIEYEVVDTTTLRLCATFLTPTPKSGSRRMYGRQWSVTDLEAVRQKAGRHCYEIDLSS